MAGTREGGIAARNTNLRKHGADFYARIGAIGGKKGHTGGFAYDIQCFCSLSSVFGGEHYKRQCAGYLGGKKSRRTKQSA